MNIRYSLILNLILLAGCASNPAGPTATTLDPKSYSCKEEPTASANPKHFNIYCSASMKLDPAQMRAYIEQRGTELCHAEPGHTVTSYTEGVGVSGCSDARFRIFEAIIECQ